MMTSAFFLEKFCRKNLCIQCLSPAKKYGKKQVRNITSWICDGKFGKSYEYSKAYILSFYKYKFF